VQIQYTLKGESLPRFLVVLVPMSTVTVNNPATQTGGS